MQLYREESSNPTYDAQRNLMGRTHYVDPDTLKFHKSRVLSTCVYADGLLYTIIESTSLDFHNTKRGFRYVIFDVFGTVIDRLSVDESFTSRRAAEKALGDALQTIDAIKLTREALMSRKKSEAAEHSRSLVELKKLAAKK